MDLANLWFGRQTTSLQGQMELARRLGFPGLGLLTGGILPSEGRVVAESTETTLPRVAVLSLDLLLAPSTSAVPAWQEVPIPTILSGLKALCCRQLLVPCGLDARRELRARADKLLARVHAGEVITAKDEALEQLMMMSELEAERQLEHLAAFLHALRRAAPGLDIALRPEASAASLLDPGRLRLLLHEIQDLKIGFWHDTGVAELRRAGGLDEPGAWLDGFSNLMSGSTLHDFSGGAVHLPPGDGMVDWVLLAEYLPRAATRILAVAPSYPGEVLVEARTALESRLPS